MTAPLRDRPRRLLAALPDPFATADARAAAGPLGVAERTAEGYLRDLLEAEAIRRVERGRYEKAEPARGAVRVPRAVRPQPVPEGAGLEAPALRFNKELSWLDFNWRVLAQALDERVPLAERVRFLAITANNLDEFVRKRVGGLTRQRAAGVVEPSPDGRSPEEQLALVDAATGPMWAALHGTWTDALAARAAAAGVAVRRVGALPDDARRALAERFERDVLPLLTPLAVDPGRPFPHISNGSLSLAVTLRNPVGGGEHFARLKVPTSIGRFVDVPSRPGEVVALEDLIRAELARVFLGMEVVGAWAFRVTRNADLERNEDEAEDLLAMISEELRERRFAHVVRVEVEAEMPEAVRALLRDELGVEAPAFWPAEAPLDLTGLSEIAGRLSAKGLGYAPWSPVVPDALKTGEGDGPGAFFERIRAGSVLVHHPYHSFAATTQRLVEEAAADPDVLAIKATLYRTSDDSPIVRALAEAAERGKQVAALVELKARFDEANNIEWARVLEDSGVHVAYGLVGLKTHSKVALVVRREGGRLRLYGHVGTGNYHPKTAQVYTDLGLITAVEAVGRDLVQLFHVLTGYAVGAEYDRLMVAPQSLRDRFVALVRREAEVARGGGRGRIVAKMNALDDVGMIRELYAASRAGVEIDLVVRGLCRLRPGLDGVSETVRVRSIVGRFLEHDRIWWFGGGGEPEVFLGSADWMRRNLDDRVEAVLPVTDERHRAYLRAVLRSALEDSASAWTLDASGTYAPPPGGPGGHDHQRALMAWAEAHRVPPAFAAEL